MALPFGRERRERRQAPPPPAPAPTDLVRPEQHLPASPAGPTEEVLGGRYALGEPLGAGGEASVHVARDLVLGREVAVKRFHTRLAPPSATSLQAIEARVVAALNHSALTTLFDAGVHEGPDGAQLYLVMEYVRGESLRDRLKRGALEVSEACWLGFDLAEGLDSMHQSGFVHRDVKPANILISELRSARPVVAKLTDFGIATLIGQPDLSEFTVGTAAYLSPEQVEGHDAGPESDVYSLGLVLLEAMTGRREFPGTVEQSAFERLVRDPHLPDTLPAPVAELLRRMTARAPRERIALHDLAVGLQQFLVDDLVRRRIDRPAALPPAAVGGDDEDVAAILVPGRFDTALRLTAGALGTPYALLLLELRGATVVAGDHGFAERVAIETAPPRGDATAEGWTVEDALLEPSLAGHPLVAGPAQVRSIAAATIVHRDGGALGHLLVLDRVPRRFDAAELRTLADYATLIGQDVELRTAMRRALFPNR